MATIGGQLTSPENGWTRFNCDFESITFSVGWSLSTGMGSYNGNDKRTTSSDETIEFKFYGSGMRLITPINNDLSTSVKIEIDDIVETYSQRNGSLQWQTIVYEKTNMELKEHSVKITTLTSGTYGLNIFDCVDIEDGHICKSDCNHATIPSISHKNASLAYMLPMATTNEINAKTNDSREGLLGMANDVVNYGDLYVVGKDGKAHLTKSGIKSKIIFDGVASSIGEYNLTDNIKKFKCILVMAKIDHTNELLNDSTSDIVYNAEFEGMKYRCMSVYFSSESHYSIEYRLIDDKLEIYTTKKGTSSVWSNPHIYQIIGIY